MGTFLSIASTTLAGMTQSPVILARVPTLVFWLLPALYIFCDFAEDSLIFSMLSWPPASQSLTFAALTAVSEIAAVVLGIVQVLLPCVLSYGWPNTS